MRTDDGLLPSFVYIRSLFGCGFFNPFEKLRFFFPSGAAVLIYLRATRCTTLSLRGGASNAFFKFEHAAYHKTVHDFLKNFWRTAVEFFMFVLEGANHS